MNESERCPKCDSKLSTDAPEGLCPACLFQQALDDSDVEIDGQWPSKSPAPVFVPPAPADLARYFPQLEILELVGQGGMGAVYQARQTKLDRLIAVKILPPVVARDPAFAERFMREARSLARLNHPQIVTVYDFGETNGLFYFSMEFVDGKNLRQLLEAGNLPQARVLPIVSQVCEALRYAHDEGIVHRDIKPENILLDRRGRVKIADFGLAKLVGLTPAYLTLTGAHEVMGTLYYMAPEQTRRSHQVDHRADIYSLGVVCYEMLTGELPLGRFAPPSNKAPVDVRLDAVVMRALAREPEHRYQDAGAMKQDVDAIGSGMQGVSALAEPASVLASWPSVRFHIARTSKQSKKYHGAIYRNETELIVEFEEDGNMEDLEIKVKQIPLTGIASLSVEWNWQKGFNELVIKPARLSVLSGLPASKSGRGHFQIDWHEWGAAKKLVASVRHGVAMDQSLGVDPERTRMAIVAPAIGLLLTSVVALTGNCLILVISYINEARFAHGSFSPVYPLIFLGAVASFVAAAVLGLGAIRMLQHRSYPLAVAATLLAMLPWSPVWPLSLPTGIWALIVLRKRAVMEEFLAQRRESRSGENHTILGQPRGAAGRVRAL